jgi:p-aminobenzoyl-glutamate transporter AbgT
MSQSSESPKTLLRRFTGVIEMVGNKVRHLVAMFLVLIAIVWVLSHFL